MEFLVILAYIFVVAIIVNFENENKPVKKERIVERSVLYVHGSSIPRFDNTEN